MSTITKTKEMLTGIISPKPQKWRWYHGLAFYIITQFLTFSLSALTSVISGNKGKDLRENILFERKLVSIKMLHNSSANPAASNQPYHHERQ